MEKDHNLDIFKQELLDAFDIWKNGKSSIVRAQKLNNDLLFAERNGIELLLRVPMQVLEEGRPNYRRNVLDYVSKVEGESGLFYVAPNENLRDKQEIMSKYHLGIIEYQNEQYLYLSNWSEGMIAMFKGSEVSSLEIK